MGGARAECRVLCSSGCTGNACLTQQRFYGGFGDEALAVIKLVIDQGKKMGLVWQPREVVYRIYRSIAVAIARGNAEIVQANLDGGQCSGRGEGRVGV